MNAQLDHVLARNGTAVTRMKSLLQRGRAFAASVLVPLIGLVILALLTLSAPAGTAHSLGQVTEFSTGLPAGSYPEWIAAGPDGNLWFTDQAGAFGRITLLRDGTPIAGQTAPTYIPTAGDVGQRLRCRVTVTYPLPFSVTATATSPAVTIQSAPPPPPPPTPALSALDISPRMSTLTGRRLGERGEPSSRLNRRERS